jgi:hypothetical protein
MQTAVIITEGQGAGKILDRLTLIDFDVLLVHIVQITGARFRDVVEKTEQHNPTGIRFVIELSQSVSDKAGAKDMLRNRFGTGAEELEAGTWSAFEHSGFEEEIGDVFHGAS